MNKEKYILKLEQFYKNNIEISKRKSNDYASSEDPFSNFRMVEQLGLTVEQGILVRMGDKYARLAQLLGKGKKSEVLDEKITDTLADLANYSAILAVFMEPKPEEVTFKSRIDSKPYPEFKQTFKSRIDTKTCPDF